MAIPYPEGRDELLLKEYRKLKNAHKVGVIFGITRERVRQILEMHGVVTPRKRVIPTPKEKSLDTPVGGDRMRAREVIAD